MKVTGLAAWAFVTKPKPAGTYKGQPIPPAYAINVVLDVATAKDLKAKGLTIKIVEKDIPGIEDAIGKPYLVIKKKAEYKDTLVPPPQVVDSQLNPFSGLIGNGSKVHVVFAANPWEMMGQTGVSASLRKVQVVDLVEYVGKDDLESFDTEDGFVASTSDQKAAAPTAEESHMKSILDDDVDF